MCLTFDSSSDFDDADLSDLDDVSEVQSDIAAGSAASRWRNGNGHETDSLLMPRPLPRPASAQPIESRQHRHSNGRTPVFQTITVDTSQVRTNMHFEDLCSEGECLGPQIRRGLLRQ